MRNSIIYRTTGERVKMGKELKCCNFYIKYFEFLFIHKYFCKGSWFILYMKINATDLVSEICPGDH